MQDIEYRSLNIVGPSYLPVLYIAVFICLEKAMAPHSSTLAWKIPWMEEPGRLQSMGSLRVGHDWATSLSLFTFMHWRRKCQPLQCSCLENPRDWGAWWAAVYGVAQSQTRLKQLSSSSSSICLILYWSMIDLQCCVSFRCIARWFSYTYTYIYCFSDSFPI